jgi:hypothetical protein
MLRRTLAVFAMATLTVGVLGSAPPSLAAIESQVAPRRPAHAYLPGAHELPPGLIESGNSYQEYPYGSLATRTFTIQPLHVMSFYVFAHDASSGAQDWLVNMVALANPG